MAEAMRLCSLRAGLSRVPEVSAYTIGNPKSWLGVAYHQVLEVVAGAGIKMDELESLVDRLWRGAMDAQHEKNLAHALNRRFGGPETWPGYHLARASVLLRAIDLAERAPELREASNIGGASHAVIRESTFSAFDGRLVGQPDVVREHEVIDYKSGSITEFDEVAQADVVKAAYVRQLQIYGYLIHEVLGWWPHRGILLPPVGSGAEILLHPADCERAATEALGMLDSYNEKIKRSASLSEFASANRLACKWCAYKLFCAPFWEAVTPEWSDLDGAVVEGEVESAPQAIHSGAAFSLALHPIRGTTTEGRVQISPLNAQTYPTLPNLAAGSRIRLVGLRARPDGVLVPSLRTILAQIEELPEIGVSLPP